jgi:hypothetical protein
VCLAVPAVVRNTRCMGMGMGMKHVVVGLVCMAGCAQSESDDEPAASETGETSNGMTASSATSASTTSATTTSTSDAETTIGTTAMETTDGETTVGTTTMETTDGESTETTTGGEEGVIQACGLADPCAQYNWQCTATSPGECADIEYDENLLCALETLVAGAPAQLTVYFNGYLRGEAEWLDVAILGDGDGLQQYSIQNPDSLAMYYTDPEHCTLRETSWFEACIADDGDEQQHADCMNPYRWFEDDCVPATTCP